MKLIRNEEDFEVNRQYWVRWPRHEVGETPEEWETELVVCQIKEKGRVFLVGEYSYLFSETKGDFIGPVPEPEAPDFEKYLTEEKKHETNN